MTNRQLPTRQRTFRALARRRSALLGATAVVLVASTVAAAPARAPRPADDGARAYGVRVAAARAAAEGINWNPCPKSWGLGAPIECGWVDVPADYADPFGTGVRIAVDRVRSTGTKAQRQGALLYNPGGPGGSGLAFPRRVTTRNPLWTATAKAYDFVGFDPRGVGHSAAISCEDPREFAKSPKPDPVPADEAAKALRREVARQYADGCRQRSGGLLPFLNTPDSARDMDVIRAALGERRLNYLGASYGTYLGAVYADLFPTHVRRMIVDSVVNPARDQIWYRNNLDQDVAFQGRWADFTAWVARYDAVYRLGATPAEVARQWERLRATAGRHPLGGVVGPAELLHFFQNAPYYDQYWTIVADAWSAYAAGDSAPLIAAASLDPRDVAGATTEENGNAVYTAVECADAKWPRSWRTWDRDSTWLNAAYPFLTWANAWMNLPCATWGTPRLTPRDVRSRPGLPDVLIVQSTRDAATPYAGALELHRRLRGSELVTERDAGSHGVTGLVNRCVNDRVTAYLVEGVLDGHDVVCAPHAEPRPAAAAPSAAHEPAGTAPARTRAPSRNVVPDLPATG